MKKNRKNFIDREEDLEIEEDIKDIINKKKIYLSKIINVEYC